MEIVFSYNADLKTLSSFSRSCLVYLITAVLFCGESISQTTKSIQLLKQKILNADSIILISHKITDEYAVKIVPDWDASDTSMNLQKWIALHPASLPFFINNKLNRQIVKEYVVLKDTSRIKLSKILLRQVNLNSWAPARCDMPQHSIIFYRGNSQSFIDICFECRRIHSSNDIAFDEMNADKRKWNELIAFFKLNGLTKVFREYEQINKNCSALQFSIVYPLDSTVSFVIYN